MKKIAITLLSFLLLINSSYALEEVSLGKMPKEKYKLAPPPKNISGSLLIKDKKMIDELIQLQKDKDIADIEILWKGAVSNNKVIEFALKKLSTPESQRRIHASLMSKTLSAIVTGASFIPCMFGSDAAIQTGSFSAGRIAQSLINKKNTPTETPLTDTELIQLACLIEELQDTIISNYYKYKNALNTIKNTRSRMMLYSKNYNNALATDDLLEISISSSLYDDLAIQEYNEEQIAKKYHSILQRISGKTAVDKLALYQYDFSSALIQGDKK